jgi:hypothetical protein
MDAWGSKTPRALVASESKSLALEDSESKPLALEASGQNPSRMEASGSKIPSLEPRHPCFPSQTGQLHGDFFHLPDEVEDGKKIHRPVVSGSAVTAENPITKDCCNPTTN